MLRRDISTSDAWPCAQQAVRDEAKAWFDNTLQTRLNDKANGRIVSIQQRLLEDDLPAYLLEKGYDHLNLPSIAEKEETIPLGRGRTHLRQVGDLLSPERENRAILDRLRRELGPAVFAAQYLQDPVAPEGNLLRMEWFGTYQEAPTRESFQKIVQSWDTGMSAAPTSHAARKDPAAEAECRAWRGASFRRVRAEDG